MDYIAIAKDFGFPILCVIACAWFIRWLVVDRFRALEGAVTAGLVREELANANHLAAQKERIRSSDAFAQAMREMAERTTRALERNTAVSEKNQDVLARLMEHLARMRCWDDREPRPQTFHQEAIDRQRPPSVADVPTIEPPTDQHERRSQWTN